MYDARHFPGQAAGPVTAARVVDIGTEDFVDAHSFVWHALAAGAYTFRPASATADLTLTLAAGGYPQVAGVPILCTAVRAGAGLSILVANL